MDAFASQPQFARAAMLCVVAALTVTACIDEEAIRDDIEADIEAANRTEEDRICDLLGADPIDLSATAEADTSAPFIRADETHYAVTFADAGGPKQGALQVTLDAASTLTIYLGSPVPFALTDAAGQPLTPAQETQGAEDCAALAATYAFAVDAGTYLLVFGPTNATGTALLATTATGDDG